MKLSKSKPNIRHKKIISANIGHIKNSISKTDLKDYTKNQINDKKNLLATKNDIKDLDINNDSELVNTTQLDWVKSVIEVKTKNNEIIKLSLDNDNCFEQQTIKVNKNQKFKIVDTNDKNEFINCKNNSNDDDEDDIKLKNTENIVNEKNNISNKIDNKESVNVMISTKDSEKIENNYKYLSNRKNNNIVSFPNILKNNNSDYNDYNETNNNNEEDIVNMKTLTYFNIDSELSGNNNNKNNINGIYKKRIKTGYLNSKNKQKGIIKHKKFEKRNDNNNLSNNIKFHTNEFKAFKNGNKIYSHKNIGFANNNIANDIQEFDNSSFNNYTLNNISSKNNSQKIITSYLTSKKRAPKISNMKLNISKFDIKKSPVVINNKNKESSNDNKIVKNLNKNIINNDSQKYQFITPIKNKFNKSQSVYPITKFIKKNIQHKYLSSSNNKSNLLLKNFLSQINMQKYYTILKENGFDNINLLIEQMRTNMPISDSELKKAGINIPGDRAKILIRLEEKGNLFPFSVPKNVYHSLDKNTNINEDEKIMNLRRWLKEFRMENYLNNFIKNGYYTVELFLFQMISKNPINDDILEHEIGIEKIGHRSRILSILKEESKCIQEKLERLECINIMDETKNCGCYII